MAESSPNRWISLGRKGEIAGNMFLKDLYCRHVKTRACFGKDYVKFKHIYFTSIEKQVLTTSTNLSRFCFLGTTPVLAPNVWANEKSQS